MLEELSHRLRSLAAGDAHYAVEFVDLALRAALQMGASDVHFQPAAQGLEVHFRLDGVLQSAGCFPRGAVSDVVTRLKVLAALLTYRCDAPQEGRLQWPGDAVEMRLSTIPTLHGERGVVRLFSSRVSLHRLRELHFPPALCEALGKLLAERCAPPHALARERETAGPPSTGKCRHRRPG